MAITHSTTISSPPSADQPIDEGAPCYTNSIPNEMLALVFSKLPPDSLLQNALVSIRWRTSVHLVFKQYISNLYVRLMQALPLLYIDTSLLTFVPPETIFMVETTPREIGMVTPIKAIAHEAFQAACTLYKAGQSTIWNQIAPSTSSLAQCDRTEIARLINNSSETTEEKHCAGGGVATGQLTESNKPLKPLKKTDLEFLANIQREHSDLTCTFIFSDLEAGPKQEEQEPVALPQPSFAEQQTNKRKRFTGTPPGLPKPDPSFFK